jgi:hypothetical protein
VLCYAVKQARLLVCEFSSDGWTANSAPCCIPVCLELYDRSLLDFGAPLHCCNSQAAAATAKLNRQGPGVNQSHNIAISG